MDFEYMYILEWGMRLVMGPVIVLRRGPPSTALAWLVVVFTLPVFGTIAYLLVGESRLGRKSSSRHRAVVETLSRTVAKTISETHVVFTELRPSHQLVSNLARGLGGGPALGSNAVSLLQEVEDLATQLVADLDASVHHCHLLYYIFHDDAIGRRVAEAMIRASRRGVRCRLLVDAVGSKTVTRRPLWAALREAGVVLAAALPVNPVRAVLERLDLRNHRKLAVVDGRIAYVGSHNISEPRYPGRERFGSWIDASARLVGPAVQLVQELFVQDWCASGGALDPDPELFPSISGPAPGSIPVQIVPAGPGQRDAPMEKVVLQGIHLARHRVVLTTPYFVPDEPLVDALCAAGVRGVDVSLVVPGRSDSPVAQAAGRSRYGDLLAAGVKIHEFRHGLLHAKTMTVDGEFCLIGTANLDIRSFYLNFEVGMLVYDDDFTSQLHFLQRIYMEQSLALTLDLWRRRGFGQILADNIFKLLSPIL